MCLDIHPWTLSVPQAHSSRTTVCCSEQILPTDKYLHVSTPKGGCCLYNHAKLD